jgi:gliding motility-associated-like protein
VRDSATVTPPPIIQTKDVYGCNNTSLQISTTQIPNVKYAWTFKGAAIGATFNPSLNVLPDTNYYKVEVKDLLECSSFDSVRVVGIPVPKVNINDTVTCSKEVVLKARPTNIKGVDSLKLTYTWSRNNVALLPTSNSLTVLRPDSGLYRVKIMVENCPGKDSALVRFNPIPSALKVHSYKICAPDSVEIDGGKNVGSTYVWMPGNLKTRNIKAKEAGRYYVSITNKYNCTTVDSADVIHSCIPKVHIPNAFLPDSDPGSPDKYFKVFGTDFTNFKVIIFSRWGEIIFYSEDKNIAWDGTYRGQPLDIGVYPYIITYEGTSPDFKGPYKVEGQVVIVK